MGIKDIQDVRGANDRLQGWLHQKSIPLWFERGIDWQRGGYYEKLDLRTVENMADYKRLRVVARQIFVFSYAGLTGFSEASAAVAHGLEFLESKARRPDGGYAIRFDMDGAVIDDRRDLYDSAFVIFALAFAYRFSKDSLLEQRAAALLEYLARHFKHPGEGYEEELPLAAVPRRQNPHMHLLEACLAWIPVASSPEPFVEVARSLVALFESSFYHNGAVLEFLSNDLQPLDSDLGQTIEPGHSYEWAWLLHQWEALGQPACLYGDILFDEAERFGIAEGSDLVFEEVWLGNRDVKVGSHRLWAQTERLKACVAQLEKGRLPAPRVVDAVRALESFAINSPTDGLMCERAFGDGSFSDEPAPASSVYHVTYACAELDRVAAI